MANQPTTSKSGRKSIGCAGILTLLTIAAFVGLIIIVNIQTAPGVERDKKIREQLEPYVNQYASSIEGTKLVFEEPYIEGKLVVIRSKKGESELELFFNDQLQATTPDEVSTVVLVNCDDRRVVSKYENGAKAYRVICNVTVVNLIKQIRFPTKELEGGDPPKSIIGDQEYGIGSEPTYQAFYIYKLPRK